MQKNHCDILCHSVEKNVEFRPENQVTIWKSALRGFITFAFAKTNLFFTAYKIFYLNYGHGSIEPRD